MNKLYLKAEELEKYLTIDELNKIIPISKGDILSVEDLINMIDDLYYEYKRLEEKLEDEIQNRQDNYEPISPYKMYGVNEKDFH